MSNKVDLLGKKFGLLLVTKEVGRSPHGKVLWECLCDCGRKKTVISGNLVQNKSLSCGTCVKIPNLLGKTFDGITVVEYLGIDYNSTTKKVAYWLVKDIRGFTKKLRTAEILAHKRTNKVLPKHPDDIEISSRYSKYKSHSKEKNREFKITFNEFNDLVKKSCHYCGNIGGHSHNSALKFNGLDRIDSTKGYTLDNVVSSCYTCNRAKSNMPYKTFIEWINNLVNYRKADKK